MSDSVFENPDFHGSVLLVENDRNGRRLLAEILTRLGFKVSAACDAAEAMKHMEALPALDLLLTDLVLPGINGVQLSNRVREQHPGVKVVFTSGFTEFAARQFGFALDGPLLEKPICSAALKAMVAEVMQPSRSMA